MPYADNYCTGSFIFKKDKGGFVHKELKPDGFIPLEAIQSQVDVNGVSQLDKYNLKVGDVTPFTNLRITDLKLNYSINYITGDHSTCIYCNNEMVYDSSEGASYDETHLYYCPNCDASCIVHENLSENTWYRDESK